MFRFLGFLTILLLNKLRGPGLLSTERGGEYAAY
jgi:hypothetical protein